jgi:hypothetical protein
MSRPLRSNLIIAASALAVCVAAPLQAQTPAAQCDFSDLPGVVWWGTEREMSLGTFAAHLAPIYWFSPDEPLLEQREGPDIRLPESFPFEEAPDAPVVYYQLEEILGGVGEQTSFYRDSTDIHNSIIDLEQTGVFRMGFFAYFRSEVGLGAHPHDLEATEFKGAVLRSDSELVQEWTAGRCDEQNYVIIVTRVTGKAHGIQWFWNVVDVDIETKFPMTILVEEGKHGLATDKNGDGYFTPGYDVNRHINDAWGVRDNIRGGALLSGGYQAWMTKVRHPQHRVHPPLPEDSQLWPNFERRTRYDGGEGENAVYELRPLPPAELGEYDKGLHHFMEDKEVEDWPELTEASEFQDFVDWVDADKAVKSLAISLYADGDLGFAWVFPLFIVKNMEVKVSGGFLVWRMYAKDDHLQDFGWMLMYANSASRWIDSYLAMGAEWDREVVDGVKSTQTDFVLETGIKFRVNVTTSALKFLSFATDFWGFRAGVKNYGFFDIDRLTYVLEFGAGAW